jgi:Serine/threonine protein phosphatase
MNKMKPIVYAHTECVKGKKNEDVICVQEISDSCSFYILADGMGGYSHGAMAAKIVVNKISNYILLNIQNEDSVVLLQGAMNQANLMIEEKSKELHCKMGATVSILLCKEDIATIAWLGNVRIYRIRNEQLERLTEDHVLTGCPHIVTRCIKGKTFETEIPCIQTPISPLERFVLCSDGFYNLIKEEDIANFKSEDIPLLVDGDDDYSVLNIVFQ